MAKTETKTLERTYNVPLRKEYLKVPRWKRTERAVSALRHFLQRHLKSEEIKISPLLNQALWQHGIKNPPHHIKVTARKDEKGLVLAELFGHPLAPEKKKEKPSKLKEVAEKIGLKTQEKKEEKEKPPEEKTGKNPQVKKEQVRKEQAR